ncbi:hypothetical protein QQ020_03960 [Fulvivirgaceae bacterium BMA12]|uniref:Uncharacterized protein n=1 Tax=Agaribacillus aureus TaxID=3051825 RepID=A0ABT8L0H1_9BACT|nr:hypothetical protein [Fulvivirgaceae bacterium BMA12]
MKTKTKESEKIAYINQLAYEAAMQDRQAFEAALPDVLAEVSIVCQPEKKKATKPANKRARLARRLHGLVYSVYQGKKHLINHIDTWIKFVALCTDQKNHIGSEEYLDLLFFLFTFKEELQAQKREGSAGELLKFIDSMYGRKHLIREIEKWIKFIALCTGKVHYTGSKEYLELLGFLFEFKEVLEGRKQAGIWGKGPTGLSSQL